jgi:hypothetical protein
MHLLKVVPVAVVGLALTSAAFATSAFARPYADDVTRHCSQVVGRMSFPGDAGERNRDRLLDACLENGGTIPG